MWKRPACHSPSTHTLHLSALFSPPPPPLSLSISSLVATCHSLPVTGFSSCHTSSKRLHPSKFNGRRPVVAHCVVVARVCVCETRPVNDFTPLNLCYSFFTPVSQQHSTSLSLCKVSYKYVNDGMLMSQDCSLKSGGASDVGTARQDFGIRVCVCVFYYYLPI